MRKPIRTDWGIEVIVAQEEWMTASFLEIGKDKGTEYQAALYDIVFHVMDGIIMATLGNNDYEFGYGKTLLIKKGTEFKIFAIEPARLLKVAQYKLEDKDLAKGNL
jgi:mannose-6-phosphate isomerase-like protein (cupin superfamily)